MVPEEAPPPSTRQLYVRANEGESQALEELLARMRPRLEAWIALRMGSSLRARVEAEDLVQEILMKAAGSIDDYEVRGRHGFYSWLFTIARNQLLDYERKYAAAKRDPARDRAVHSAMPAEQTRPLSRLVRSEVQARLLAVLERLPERDREIIRLRRFEYLTTREAAERIGISEKNASVRFTRAMEALRARMSDEDPGGAST